MIDFSPCLLMCRCPIVIFITFYICFFINTSMRPVQVLRKPCFITLRRTIVFGLKSAAWKYCAGSGLVVWARILFSTIF